MDPSDRTGMELHRCGRSLDQPDLFEETLCFMASGYLDPFAERGCVCVGWTVPRGHTLPELEEAAALGTVAVPRLAALASFDRFVRRSARCALDLARSARIGRHCLLLQRSADCGADRADARRLAH